MKVFLILASYLIGAIPSGYLLVKLKTRKDIREVGSGSTGTTNVFRYQGWKLAIPVMLIDISKGFFPAFFTDRWFQDKELTLLVVLAAVVGHCFPIYLKFKGGKGVATSAGGFLYLAPMPLLLSLLVMVIILFLFRYVSLATLTGLLVFPLLVLIIQQNYNLFSLGLIIFFLVAWRHKDNIKRLLTGTERKFGEKLNG
ncbi:MAG: glycerol-3-phosphate 1-O-acyltransferase PlsY [Candidatus Saccharicenans sp.]|nr:MAG: acyl-phosphate glycerol 3-phosphate acyltransferase [Candidatus Aminicenantes bacterium]HEK85115.1 glycerol-3-phosphate 1-O-acyltransferase [Candidatus Aminicenantes bacterium]